MGLIVYLSFNVAAGLLGCPLIDLSVQFVPQNAPVTPVLSSVRFKTIIALGISIFIGVIAYGAAILLLRAVQKEDIEMLPKGKKIAIFLQKHKILS